MVAIWVTRVRRRREDRSEEHTSELQSLTNLVCRLLLEKKKAACRGVPLRSSCSRTSPRHLAARFACSLSACELRGGSRSRRHSTMRVPSSCLLSYCYGRGSLIHHHRVLTTIYRDSTYDVIQLSWFQSFVVFVRIPSDRQPTRLRAFPPAPRSPHFFFFNNPGPPRVSPFPPRGPFPF